MQGQVASVMFAGLRTRELSTCLHQRGAHTADLPFELAASTQFVGQLRVQPVYGCQVLLDAGLSQARG